MRVALELPESDFTVLSSTTNGSVVIARTGTKAHEVLLKARYVSVYDEVRLKL